VASGGIKNGKSDPNKTVRNRRGVEITAELWELWPIVSADTSKCAPQDQQIVLISSDEIFIGIRSAGASEGFK
jgi:hypothetical protein